MEKHVIREGESLDTIAKEYKMTVENIIEDNKIQDRDRLGVGNILEIREVTKNSEKISCNKKNDVV